MLYVGVTQALYSNSIDNKMKSLVTNKGTKLTKTAKFKIKKLLEKDQERVFEIIL